MMAALGRKKIPRYAAPMALELEEREMRRMGERALERILEHLRSLPEQPLHAVTGGKKLARSLREPLPERGVPFDRLMNTLFGRVIPHSLNTASPGYLAYIPGGGLFQAALADFIALATNRYSTVWLAAPGLVQLEENVVQWFCEVLGLPTGAGGLLTSGGSMANLIALVAARRDRLPPDFLSGVLYTSSQAHHSVAKAAAFAGFPGERVRSLPVDGLFRLDLAALEAAVTEDRAAGLQPVLRRRQRGHDQHRRRGRSPGARANLRA
jgi:aromatic-L-amino-acid decarboxylase